ncbi:MAG: hypothetical protein GX248_01830 [Peptococcaceae bacterium]|nr:hypothetical protein [Peptococcaceae bacterium]
MMKRTGIFIRDDQRLLDAIKLLHKKTKLLYVIYKDSKINSAIEKFCFDERIKCIKHEEFANLIEMPNMEGLDYLFSYYYQKKVEKRILDFPAFGCVNFHPAPLPYYRGVGNYAMCIMNKLDYWGVSAHFMDEQFDNGMLIQVLRFDVDSEKETYTSLERKTHSYMYQLFSSVIDAVCNNTISGYIPCIDREEISYLSRSLIKELKQVTAQDSTEVIDRKIRAFWCPPYHGACITINGKQYTLIDEQLLSELAGLYDK